MKSELLQGEVLENIMEQSDSSIQSTTKPVYRRQNSSSIMLPRDSRSSYRSEKALTETEFLQEYEKIMEFMESCATRDQEAIDMFKQLLDRSALLRNSRSKLYYVKENIFINLIKLLNKQNLQENDPKNQHDILELFNNYLPGFIRQAKSFQATKGSIVTLMVLWSKCYYALQMYEDALRLLEQADKVLDSLDQDKINNQLKISFLRSRIYHQQSKTAEEQAQIEFAFNIVKNNNILSSLGLKIIQLHNNVNYYQQRLNSVQVKTKGQSMHSPAQRKPRSSHKNNQYIYTKSITVHNQKNHTQGKSIQKEASKLRVFGELFNYVKGSPYRIKKLGAGMTESQINNQLTQLNHVKSSNIESNILKRPQYRKHCEAGKSKEQIQSRQNIDLITEQLNPEPLFTEKVENSILGLNKNSILLEEENENSSHPDSNGNQEEEKEYESSMIAPLEIVPLNFPSEYQRPAVEDEKEEILTADIQYQNTFWQTYRLLALKRATISYNQDMGLLIHVYFHNCENVVAFLMEDHIENQFLSNLHLPKYLAQKYSISLQDDNADIWLHFILAVLLRRYLTDQIKSHVGRIHILQEDSTTQPRLVKFVSKDRLRFTRLQKSKKSLKPSIYLPAAPLKKNDLSQVLKYQKHILQPKVYQQVENYVKEVKQHLSISTCGVQYLMSPSPKLQSPMERCMITGKYTFSGFEDSSFFLQKTEKPECLEIIHRVLECASEAEGNMIRKFYELAKYNMIMDEYSHHLYEYLDSKEISTLEVIQGMGSCRVVLKGYSVKHIYLKPYCFLKFQITPCSTKTKKIKLILSREDIEQILKIQLKSQFQEKGLFEILSAIKQKFIYVKNILYHSLVVLKDKGYQQEHSENNKIYGYNKFTLYEQQFSNPTSFLTTRLQEVKILKQKTIKIQLNSSKIFCILTIERFQGLSSLRILIYVPQTNRNFSFTLSLQTLQSEIQQFSGDIIDWDKVISMINFNTVGYGALVSNIGSYCSLVTECHFSSFGKVFHWEIYSCFKIIRKRSNINSLLSRFQNIVINQLPEYEVYLQLHWLKEKKSKICLTFPFADFIELVLSLKKIRKIHPELQCLVFNLADISLMLKIGYQKMVAALISIGKDELQNLVGTCNGKIAMRKAIEQMLVKNTSHLLDSVSRPTKVSLNLAKNISRTYLVDVVHKGVFRMKNQTVCGIFKSKDARNLVIKIYDKSKRAQTITLSIDQIHIPFVGEHKHEVLRSANNRIFKMIKNKLMLSKQLTLLQAQRKVMSHSVQ